MINTLRSIAASLDAVECRGSQNHVALAEAVVKLQTMADLLEKKAAERAAKEEAAKAEAAAAEEAEGGEPVGDGD